LCVVGWGRDNDAIVICVAVLSGVGWGPLQIGTDIQDNKCGWLVVQALERATPAQRELLQANYGRHDDECVAKVKELYKEMNIEQVGVVW
jgi:hypothetical protein